MPLVFKKVLIKGEKVQLRPIRTADAHLAFSMVKDEEILKWLLWDGPKDEEEIATTYRQWESEFGSKKDCFLAIERINVPGIIGCISLNRRDCEERADMGYWLAVAHWSKGYMTNAIRLICYLGFRYLGLVKIYSPVFVGNTRSKRVLEKNGFSLEGVLRSHFKKRGEWRDVWYMALLRSEWQQNQHRFSPSYEDVVVVEVDD